MPTTLTTSTFSSQYHHYNIHTIITIHMTSSIHNTTHHTVSPLERHDYHYHQDPTTSPLHHSHLYYHHSMYISLWHHYIIYATPIPTFTNSIYVPLLSQLHQRPYFPYTIPPPTTTTISTTLSTPLHYLQLYNHHYTIHTITVHAIAVRTINYLHNTRSWSSLHTIHTTIVHSITIPTSTSSSSSSQPQLTRTQYEHHPQFSNLDFSSISRRDTRPLCRS